MFCTAFIQTVNKKAPNKLVHRKTKIKGALNKYFLKFPMLRSFEYTKLYLIITYLLSFLFLVYKILLILLVLLLCIF